MTGFSSIFGYIVTFFILIGLFFGGVVIFTNQLMLQKDMVEIVHDNNNLRNNQNFFFENPSYSSGRLYLDLNNAGSTVLSYLEDNQYCFEVYFDNNYVSKENVFLNPDLTLLGNYNTILGNNKAIFNLFLDVDKSKNNTLKFISCDGNSKYYSISSDLKYNYYDLNWKNVKKINIENPSNFPMEEYQVIVELDSLNYDFTENSDEIRFVIPTNENNILDLTFDEYNQQINDFSRYSNNVVLGNTLAVNANDPQKEKGILFNGLKFDGTNDYLTIASDISLRPNREFTFSSFVKWDNSSGNALQYLFVNGNVRNSVAIINDGGPNNKKIQFNLDISGTLRTLYSTQTLDNNWHQIVCSYDGQTMRIYIDGVLSGSVVYIGDITTYASNNYIGSTGAANYFSGFLDEVKLYNIALTENEINNLLSNNLKFRELDFYVQEYDNISQYAKIFVKVPYIASLDNVTIEMYYNNSKFIFSSSDIVSTFSYNSPNVVSYVVSDRIAGTNGLSIFSLEENNNILIGNDFFNLNFLESSNIASASLNINDEIRMNYLSQIEGDGDVDDVLTPISWAGTEFYYRGFRNANDRFCILSPFGTASVEIRDNGVLEWSGNINSNGFCRTNDIANNRVLALTSNLPILVHYSGSNQDSFPFYPATAQNLYGSPSNTIFVGAGPLGANTRYYRSNGAIVNNNLGAYDSYNVGGNGADGNSNAYLVTTSEKIGVIQQADGDGSESTVFVSKSDFGTLFGSSLDSDYIAVVSDISDANCSVYNSTLQLIENVPTGVGVNGIYKYDFGVGNDNLYVSSNWYLKCDKPVWPYYEERTAGDETNLWSYLQMRQYVFPEPVVSIN